MNKLPKMIERSFVARTANAQVKATGRVSGSELTVLKHSTAAKLGFPLAKLKELLKWDVRRVKNGEMELMATPENMFIRCYILPIAMTVESRTTVVGAAVPGIDPPRNLIGLDFLNATGAVVDCGMGKLTFKYPQPKEFHVGGGLWTFEKVKSRGKKRSA